MSTSFWLPQPLSVQVALTRLPESRFNPGRFDDEVYASLFRQARAEASAAARKEIFREMQLIEYERGAAIIPVTPHQVDAYSQRVGGIEPLPIRSYPDVRGLWLNGLAGSRP
jgi:ABC-type transport system substrate-binding protein